jgi:hypothetical protein
MGNACKMQQDFSPMAAVDIVEVYSDDKRQYHAETASEGSTGADDGENNSVDICSDEDIERDSSLLERPRLPGVVVNTRQNCEQRSAAQCKSSAGRSKNQRKQIHTPFISR